MGWKFGKKPVTPPTSRNDAVRRVLRERGDDGSAVRHVIHFAYPQEGADLSRRPGLIDELEKRGFEVRDAQADNGLVFEHYRPVEDDDFDDFTEELEEWFEAAGWDYDGWECAVVPPGAVN